MLAISALSVAANELRSLLESEIEDLTVGQVLIGHPKDTFESMADDENNLNLFFYNVQFDGYPADGMSDNPLYVRLHCLITAVAGRRTVPSAGENDLRLVGEVMRVLHQKPVISVNDATDSEVAQLQIVPHPLNLDNLNHVWSTQGDTPYRLSVAYEMALAPIPLSVPVEKSPWVGEVGVYAEPDVDPDVLPASGFGIDTSSPVVPVVSININSPDWSPHICFVHQNKCRYSLALELGSIELTSFNPQIWIASDENAAIDLVWERWQSDAGWQVVSSRRNVLSVVLARQSGSATLYSGTKGNGIYKSTDDGDSWLQKNTGLNDLNLQVLTINPTSASTLFAGTSSSGIYRSDDSADTWVSKNSGLTDLNIQSLVFDAATPAILYAGSSQAGIFKSTNNGDNWVVKNTGLTALSVTSVAIDPATPTTLYAATGNGVFRSANSADGWQPKNVGMGELAVQFLVIDPVTPTTLYAGTFDGGIFRSADSGDNWEKKNTGLSDLNIQYIAIDPVTPTTLYAATRIGGLFKSINGGDSWQSKNTGIGERNIQYIAIEPSLTSTLFCSSNGGRVFSSDDGADSWSEHERIDTGLNDDFLSITPEDATTANTLAEILSDKTTSGQFLIYAVRQYSPKRDGQYVASRSNPLLVTLYEAGA